MKKNYPQYYRPVKEELDKAMKTATFVFDTNTLLDLYRINPSISDKAIKTIRKYKSRIYITPQSDYEYHRHHYEVPAQMCEMISHVATHLNFNKIKAPLDDVMTKSHSGCLFPDDLRKEYIFKLETTFNEIKKDISKLQRHFQENFNTHKLQHTISQLFENRIIPTLPADRIGVIINTEGPERYKKKVPPGYMDSVKATDADDNNAYGDLIIWMEILEFVKSKPQDIFFICRDQKEDWVAQVGDHFIGPRMELLVEFRKFAPANIFHILTLTEFLEIFGDDFSKEELDALPKSVPPLYPHFYFGGEKLRSRDPKSFSSRHHIHTYYDLKDDELEHITPSLWIPMDEFGSLKKKKGTISKNTQEDKAKGNTNISISEDPDKAS